MSLPTTYSIAKVLKPKRLTLIPRANGLALGIMLFFVCQWNVSAPAQTKHPIPSISAQSQKLEVIKDLYQKSYADTSRAGQITLAKLLFKLARVEKDVNAKFTLFNEALRISKSVNDFETAWKCVGNAAANFQFDEVQASVELIEQAAKKIELPEQAEQMVSMSRKRVQRFVMNDDYVGSIKLIKALQRLAKRARNRTLARDLMNYHESVVSIRDKYNSIQSELKKVKDKPGDPQANQVIGRFYFFDKGD